MILKITMTISIFLMLMIYLNTSSEVETPLPTSLMMMTSLEGDSEEASDLEDNNKDSKEIQEANRDPQDLEEWEDLMTISSEEDSVEEVCKCRWEDLVMEWEDFHNLFLVLLWEVEEDSVPLYKLVLLLSKNK